MADPTPRIAIPVPTTTDLAYNQRSWPNYAAAVRQAGGEPVELPLALPAAEQARLIASCHGVVLPGSPADVAPELYGQPRDPASAPADPAREALDRALLEDAQRHSKPVLAICFGTQYLNVWLGGPLLQDLTPLPVNHSAGGQVAIAHSALIPADSLLASLVDPSEAPLSHGLLRLPINSSHHQAIAAPAPGLRVVARCPDDGVIEAVELDPAVFHVEHPGTPLPFLLAVQWHPERSTEISPTSRNLFARLVAEAVPFAAGPHAAGPQTAGPHAPSL